MPGHASITTIGMGSNAVSCPSLDSSEATTRATISDVTAAAVVATRKKRPTSE